MRRLLGPPLMVALLLAWVVADLIALPTLLVLIALAPGLEEPSC